MVACMTESDSVYNRVHIAAIVLHQRYVVEVEMVAVWCWVEWNVDVSFDQRWYYGGAGYPTFDAAIIRTAIWVYITQQGLR